MNQARTLCAILALAVCPALAHAADARDAPAGSSVSIIDTHAHIVRSSRRSPSASVPQALRMMDRHKVEKTILLPPPYPPGHRGIYDLDELAGVVRDNPQRFAFVAGGGSLNPMLHDVAPQDVTPRHIEEFRQQAERIAAAGARAFGEITAEHFSAGRGNHPYESTPPDHPLLLQLARISARTGLPIDLHMEAVPQDMATPPRMRRGDNPDKLKENITAFERLLAHDRKARIIWAHCGWDLTSERTVPLMRRLLSAHPNLYMSIKVDTRGPQHTSPFAPDGGIRPAWLAMLRAFPDRFVIGSDQFFDEPQMERLPEARRLVDLLPADLAQRVASDNALQLYRLAR